MKNLCQILFFSSLQIFLISLVSTQAWAEIFWNEDFEGTTAEVESRWSSSCGSNWSTHTAISLATDKKVSGSRSMREYVNGLTSRTPEYLSETCFMDREYPDTTSIFTRWWEFTEANFQYDPSNVKSIFLGPRTNTWPNFWIGHWQGSLHLEPGGQAVAELNSNGVPYEGISYTHNKSPLNTPTEKWICIETQIVLNTMGNSNGLIRLWTDGQLNVEHTGRTFVGPNVSNPNGNSGLAKFQLLRIYAQHGVGYRWFDDIAVGNTRIGCGALPLPTKPKAPTGLKTK